MTAAAQDDPARIATETDLTSAAVLDNSRAVDVLLSELWAMVESISELQGRLPSGPAMFASNVVFCECDQTQRQSWQVEGCNQ